MTQHRWSTTDGWDILAGWDRMSQWFFIDISQECSSCNGEGFVGEDECKVCEGMAEVYIFNNLDDKTGLTNALGGMLLPQVMQVLTRYLTEYPKEFLTNVLNDREQDIGNKAYRYPITGQLVDKPVRLVVQYPTKENT